MVVIEFAENPRLKFSVVSMGGIIDCKYPRILGILTARESNTLIPLSELNLLTSRRWASIKTARVHRAEFRGEWTPSGASILLIRAEIMQKIGNESEKILNSLIGRSMERRVVEPAFFAVKCWINSERIIKYLIDWRGKKLHVTSKAARCCVSFLRGHYANHAFTFQVEALLKCILS